MGDVPAWLDAKLARQRRSYKPSGPALVNFEVGVVGDDEVAKAFEDLGSRTRVRVREKVEILARQVAQRAQSVELVQMVGRGRGRLPRGVIFSTTDGPTNTSALVYHRNRHFYILSYGSPKHETMVKPHYRRVKSHDRRTIQKARLSKRGDRTLLRWGVTFKGSTFVSSKSGGAFPRRVRLDSRPFLARSFGALGGASWATEGIREAVEFSAAELHAGGGGI